MNEHEMNKAIAVLDDWGDEVQFNVDERFMIVNVGMAQHQSKRATLQEAVDYARAKVGGSGEAKVVVEIKQVVYPKYETEVVSLEV